MTAPAKGGGETAPGTEAKAGSVSFAEANQQAPAKPATVPEVLRAAADLIEPEGKWTQGEYARDRDGSRVMLEGPDAYCFCAEGAIVRSAGGFHMLDLFSDAMGWVRRINRDNLAHWNDAKHRTQAEVVAALRKAADLAEVSQ